MKLLSSKQNSFQDIFIANILRSFAIWVAMLPLVLLSIIAIFFPLALIGYVLLGRKYLIVLPRLNPLSVLLPSLILAILFTITLMAGWYVPGSENLSALAILNLSSIYLVNLLVMIPASAAFTDAYMPQIVLAATIVPSLFMYLGLLLKMHQENKSTG
ncbi:MAG: hypothetical protein FWC86_03630 [Coriobacteriia bacterium]|nr:hypothetical protein [Coriobacteriia bacterium]